VLLIASDFYDSRGALGVNFTSYYTWESVVSGCASLLLQIQMHNTHNEEREGN